MSARRLLVIDDAEDMREIAKLFLELDGSFDVVTAGSAEEGLAEARACRPYAILLDVMMPDVDGIRTLEIIRADAALRTVPVIMLSGTVHGPGAERLHGLDVQGTIAKPFDPATLADDVSALLAGR